MEASHIPLNRAESSFQVSGVRSDPGKIIVDWQDGHQSTFHTIWLRDNCSCDQCGDHSGGHRFFELGMLPGSLANHAAFEDGMIRIHWREDHHVSTFDPAWLRSHCYSDEERSRRKRQPVLWDAGLSDALPSINYPALLRDEAALLGVFDYVKDYRILSPEKFT